MSISNSVRASLENSSWIREMFEVGERLKNEKGLENVFDFSLGNPILEPPKEVHIELLKLLKFPEKGMHRYMPNAGYYETRSFIAGLMKYETGLSFKCDDIVMTVGAGGGLNVIFKALLEPVQPVDIAEAIGRLPLILQALAFRLLKKNTFPAYLSRYHSTVSNNPFSIGV